MKNNQPKSNQTDRVKNSTTPDRVSAILDRSIDRMNRIAQAAGAGNEILPRRFHFLNERKSSPINYVMRDNRVIRDRLSQIKLKNDELETNDFKFSALKPEKEPVTKARSTKSQPLQKASRKEESKPAKSDRHTLAPYTRSHISGRPIGIMLRHRMESMLRFNFSSVRTHTDKNSAEQVKNSRADAITVGDHIYFAPGKYNPENRKGQALLVHELSHVRQQKSLKYPLSPHKLKNFEHEALANETTVLNQKVSPLPINTHPEINLPNTIRSRETVLVSEQNIYPVEQKTAPMSASVNRDLDLSAMNSTNTSGIAENDLSTKNDDFEEIYSSLKLKLQIEKERMGD